MLAGYFSKLKALIEKTVDANKAKAHLVTHSLGGPTILAFLNSMKVKRHPLHLTDSLSVSRFPTTTVTVFTHNIDPLEIIMTVTVVLTKTASPSSSLSLSLSLSLILF